MSIVISGIEHGRKLCISADKRAERDGEVIDNYEKLFKLGENIFFGMTGIAEEGFPVLRQMLNKNFSSPAELVKFVDQIFTPRPNQLTITLAGRWNSGKYFLWVKNNHGEVDEKVPIANGLVYSISGAGDERILSFFERSYVSSNDLRRAMVETIKFTSTIDSSVSEACDFYQI